MMLKSCLGLLCSKNLALGLRSVSPDVVFGTLSVFLTIILNVVNETAIFFLVMFVFGINKYLSKSLIGLKIYVVCVSQRQK